MRSFRTAEYRTHGNSECPHHARRRRRQPGRVGRRGRGRAEHLRHILGAKRRAVFGTRRQFVGSRPAFSGNEGAHFLEAGIDQLLGRFQFSLGDKPAPGAEHGAAHDAGSPDVAEHTALVAEAVGQARFAEQFIEFRPLRFRHLLAHFCNPGFNVAAVGFFSVDRRSNGAQKHVRQFDRPRFANIEAIEQAVADEIEISRGSGANRSFHRSKPVENLPGRVFQFDELARLRIGLHGANESCKFVGRSGRNRRRAAQQSKQVGWRQARPVADMRQEIAGRHHGRSGKAHVLADHLRVMFAAAGQIGNQVGVGKLVWLDCLQFAVPRDRGRLDLFVPILELLAPELAGKDFLGALEPLRHFRVGKRNHGFIAKAVDVLKIHCVEQHAVEPGEITHPALQRVGVDFHPVTGHRPRKVYGIDFPGTGPGRIEVKLLLAGGLGHRGFIPPGSQDGVTVIYPQYPVEGTAGWPKAKKFMLIAPFPHRAGAAIAITCKFVANLCNARAPGTQQHANRHG